MMTLSLAATWDFTAGERKEGASLLSCSSFLGVCSNPESVD